MIRLTIDHPIVKQLAITLFPEETLTKNRLNATLFLLLLKQDIEKHGGEKVYTMAQAAEILYPSYRTSGSKTRKGMCSDVRNYGLELTNLSSRTRGDSAIGIAMMNDRTYSLYRNSEHVDVNDVAKTYGGPFLPYTRIGVFGHANGVFIAGWQEAQYKKWIGGVREGDQRISGWDEGGLITNDTRTQLKHTDYAMQQVAELVA